MANELGNGGNQAQVEIRLSVSVPPDLAQAVAAAGRGWAQDVAKKMADFRDAMAVGTEAQRLAGLHAMGDVSRPAASAWVTVVVHPRELEAPVNKPEWVPGAPEHLFTGSGTG